VANSQLRQKEMDNQKLANIRELWGETSSRRRQLLSEGYFTRLQNMGTSKEVQQIVRRTSREKRNREYGQGGGQDYIRGGGKLGRVPQRWFEVNLSCLEYRPQTSSCLEIAH